MKEDILGTHYELSLACVSPAESKRLNRVYRKKNRSTNVLSFSLSKNHGEIIFDLKQAGHDAPSFNVSFRSFIGRLFIHACLHLKGMEHGSTMERTERNYCARFGIRV